MIGSCRDCFKNDVCKSHKDNPRVLVCNAWEELLFRRPVEFPCRFYDIFEFAIKNDMNKHITGDFIYPEFFKEYDVHETVMCSDCGTSMGTITAIIDQNGYVYCYDCANMYGIDLPGDDSHEFVRDVNGFVEKVRKNLLKEDQKQFSNGCCHPAI